MLRDTYRQFLVRLFKRLTTHHPNEGQQILVDLAVRVVKGLQRHAWEAQECAER